MVVQCCVMCWCCDGCVRFVYSVVIGGAVAVDVGINFVYTSAKTIDSMDDVEDDSTVVGCRMKNDTIDLSTAEQRDGEEVLFTASESNVAATCMCSGCTTHVILIMSLICSPPPSDSIRALSILFTKFANKSECEVRVDPAGE